VRKTQSNLVTIIGEAYFQPIADLVDGWLLRKPPAPNRVQSGVYEHGYAAAVVLLLVAMLESYVSRLRFLQGAKVSPTARSAIEVILSIYPRLRHRKALKDVYVLRDVLIHNHLLEIDWDLGGSPPMVLRKATKHLAYGDPKYVRRVNPAKLRTKALGLSVNPIRVDRRDVLKIFDTIWKTLIEFEQTNPNRFAVSYQRVRFRGNSILFHELRNLLKPAGCP
jgi:hypothetical protein